MQPQLEPRDDAEVAAAAAQAPEQVDREARIERYERFRIDGAIRIPHMYLLGVGRRRA